jgi:uncharacterized protein YbbK (DUF523 family)
MEKILVSKCLAGFCCRYDGGNNLVPEIKELVDGGLAVTACPEQLGGLPTPRIPSERVGEKVVSREGRDVTAEFTAGAEAALRIALEHGCRSAILKSRSPSCGKGCIYDGRFTGALITGNGVTTDLLLQHGIEVLTEDEYLAKLTEKQKS